MKKFTYCPDCAELLIEKAFDNNSRLVCSAQCGFVHYDNPTPVVAVIVEFEGCVVLAHNCAWPNWAYGIVTGFLERAEAPELCALREVKEELNLDAETPTLIGVYPSENMNQVIIGYHVLASGNISLNDELDDYKLVQPELCPVWPTGTGYVLRDWLRQRGLEPKMIDISALSGLTDNK